MAYLDYDGLLYFWQKIKEKINAKQDAVSGKGLSTNDYTTDEKTKLTNIEDNANNYTHPEHTAYSNGFYTFTVDGLGHVTSATKVVKSDITALGIPSENTTYSVMSGATSTTNGTSGLVPMPASGKQGQFLRGDGTWASPEDTTYTVATSAANGLMSSTDKSKLDAFGSADTYAKKSDIVGMYKYKGSVDSTSDLPTSGNSTGDVYDVGNGMNYAWNGTAWDALGEIFSITSVTNTEIDTILAS